VPELREDGPHDDLAYWQVTRAQGVDVGAAPPAE
jgi:hypothetical protein